MASTGLSKDIKEIDSISFHNIWPVFLHGYIAPFVLLYILWLYFWVFVYGVNDYYEAGLIALVVIGCFQILTCLFCYWLVSFRMAITSSTVYDPYEASWVKVTPPQNSGHVELVRLLHIKNGHCPHGMDLFFFFQKCKYRYDWENKKEFVEVTFPTDFSMQYYFDWKGYQDDEIEQVTDKYCDNTMIMDIPKFQDLFQERATAPFFVFQVFCVGLWCLDEYWYYSLFTLVMLIMFEAVLVKQQLRNMEEIRKMGNKPYAVNVYRNRKWRKIFTNQLLPGDLISISRSQEEKLIPCDLLLLRGMCIVDESMLTGESVPIMKESVESLDGSQVFDNDSDSKLHVLFGGTKIVQHTPPSKAGLKAQDNGCIAYVLRTGFNTSQGRLLKTILFGVKRVTANNIETFMFILFLLCFAVSASVYVWMKGTEDPSRSRYKLFLECTLIITSVVPAELPIELSLAVNSSLLALTKLYIFCTEPFRIPFGGKISFACFDKTGTLTSDNLVVEGVAGIHNDVEIQPVVDCPLETIHVLASCHALVQLDDDFVGDPLEKATLSATNWVLTKGDAVVPKKGKGHPLKIFTRHHFSSNLKRMSVIAGYTPSGSVETSYVACCKGAPETLKSMFAVLPDNYDDIHLNLARRGARVLALGYKKIGMLSHQELRDMKRDEVESELTFAGFVIISCPLKRDSKSAIKEVQHASHHVVMITGDSPLTACHVAKELYFTKKKNTLIMTQSDTDWHWLSVDESVSLPVLPDDGISALVTDYDLCLTGAALSYLNSQSTAYTHAILPHVRVFARVTPKQKEFVVTSLNKLGHFTLMCGDGTNDVGALKQAHVGIALIASAPERLEKRKRPREEESREQEKTAEKPSRREPQSRAAKQRAVSRGDNLAPAQKKLSTLMKEMEEEEKAQVVRLGDASIASPFTSKLSTVMAVCHIIKQGRCTLVTTLQMFKILALNALILAYSQSVLYLDGIKFSDTQATIQGLLQAGCFLFISRSKPLRTLSRERPLPNIFNVYTILTVMLQFFIHFTTLVFLTQEAHARMPPKEEKFVDLEKKFEPSLVNSVVYIIAMAMQVSTVAVNYRGHPFMEGLTENRPLMWSLLITASTVLLLSIGMLPDLSSQLEVVHIPWDFRQIIVAVLVADICAAFVIDRVLLFLFGRIRSEPKLPIPKKLYFPNSRS